MTKFLKWTEEETIVALDCYLRLMERDGELPHSTENVEVKQLSHDLLKHAIKGDREVEPDFRTYDSVLTKMMEFLALDPNFKGKPPFEATKLDEKVWEDYASDRERLSRAAAKILEGAA
jgi:hypothetical protein